MPGLPDFEADQLVACRTSVAGERDAFLIRLFVLAAVGHSPKFGNPSPLQVAMDYFSILMGTQKTRNRARWRQLFIPRFESRGVQADSL